MYIDVRNKKRKTGYIAGATHGLYCGPGWSDGDYQSSVCGYATAVDEFDQTCKEHDCAYAKYGPHAEADHAFHDSNVGRGIKRTFAGRIVLSQNNKLMYTPQNSKKKTQIVRVDVPKKNTAEAAINVSTTMSGAQAIGAHFGGKFASTKAVDAISKKMMSTSSGTQYHYETRGDPITGGEIVWFGHATIGYDYLVTQWCRSVVKALLNKCGYQFRDWNDQVAVELEGWTIVSAYHTNNTTVAISTVTTAPLFAFNTYDTLAATLFRNSWTTATAANPEIQPLYVTFQRTISTIPVILGRLWLDGQKMSIVATSRLAVQNTTLGQSADADADTTDSITAVPLVGKIYEFKGNYARKVGINQDPADLICSNHVTVTTGVANPTASLSFSEPVDSYSFYGCKKVRNIKMQPGEIKTDQFSSAFTVNTRQFFQNYTNKIAIDKSHSYGHSHFFALEKQVFINSTNAISVNVNCDNHVAVMLKPGNPYIVQPSTQHVNYST